MSDMNKTRYILKTFSRTSKKDTENYVLTGIWHRINNPDLIPVTQQYVQRPDKTYAKLDLFFPQINFAIEVDEPYHAEQEQKDYLRTEMIFSALIQDQWISCDFANSGDLIYRIKTIGKSFKEINHEIDKAVEIIKAKIFNLDKPLEWKYSTDGAEALKEKSHLSIKDNITFQYIKDITNNVFGRSYKGFQRGFLKDIYPKINLWCPKLAIDKNGVKTAPSKGWLNTLSDDWLYIYEHNEQKELSHLNLDYEKEQNILRAVFARYHDHLGINRYRFVGLFQFDHMKDFETSVYKRVKDEIEISKLDLPREVIKE